MGNLIRDFWTYTYKEKDYYGIVEVVAGELKYRNIEEKKYIHVEMALKHMLKPENNFVSHMSLQAYCNVSREQAYYPFIIEFEPKKEELSDYKNAIEEANRAATYLICELGVNERDIQVMINNSRSIYIFVNPKSYELKPDKELNRIYLEMFNMLNEELNFKYADKSMYSSEKLIKTPNCYYKGGYFVNVTLSELKMLFKDPGLKKKLTANKRSLDFFIPGELSNGMQHLYIDALESLSEVKVNKSNVKYISINMPNCIKYIEGNFIDKGCRNQALVSVAIYYKERGFTEDQILDKLIQLANYWGHDESERAIEAIVKSVFRKDYRFSCEKAKTVLEFDINCSNCPYKKGCSKSSRVKINKEIIDELYKNKASVRHFVTYLKLISKGLIDRWFVAAEEGLDDRVIRELCNFTGKLNRTKEKGKIYISDKSEGKVYYLPRKFVDEKIYRQLGEYLKHYLKIVFMGYKSYEKYIIMNVSKKKIMKVLGYRSISSVYKLLERLKELGYTIIKKGKLKALYYESYKVIELDKLRDSEEFTNETRRVVNYIHFEENGKNSHIKSRKESKRGSPG